MVTIPKQISEKAKLTAGDQVSIDYLGETIQLKPLKKRKPVTEMVGDIKIKDFDFKESLRYIKEAPYAR